jgi:8-oxo-dGTP diphosphatase
MNETMVREAGVDFHFLFQGRRMLDEPMYRILSKLVNGELGNEYFEEWGIALFGKKLELLSANLGVPIDFTDGSIPEGLPELLDCYELERRGIERSVRYGRSPSLTVDGVVIQNGKILLIRRKNEPFRGQYALPGGFVDYGERTEDAVVREIKEETGLETTINQIVGVYSDPARDPRGHTISAIYLLDPIGGDLQSGDDADSAGFFDLDELPELAFDHEQVVRDARKMVDLD